MNAQCPVTVVSNRLPAVPEGSDSQGWTLKPAAGGLITALDPVIREHGGRWIGWSGREGTLPQALSEAFAAQAQERGYRLEPVSLTTAQVRGYYHGAANRIIWPLFHNMAGNCSFRTRYWSSYVEVNRKFAEIVQAKTEPDELVWVHDYHLLLLGAELRRLGWRGRLGFFLHIPFPHPETFMLLPWRRQLMEAMLEFDLVGFQTARDRDNFVLCVDRWCGPIEIQSLPSEREHYGQVVLRPRSDTGGRGPAVVVGAFPISVDFDALERRAARESVQAFSRKLRSELRCEKMIFDAARLDYTKGLPQRLRAFRHLLRDHPELRETVTLVQYVVPGREIIPEYDDMHREIERLVSEINGEFTVPGWVPVHYVYRSLSQKQMAAYFQAADIAFNTPLNDGMNLVAKEFCAARIDGDGVLILGEQAGAADELAEGALIVNPHDIDGTAEALYSACVMPEDERRSRMARMREIVRKADLYVWVDSFLDALRNGPRPARLHRDMADARGCAEAAPRAAKAGA